MLIINYHSTLRLSLTVQLICSIRVAANVHPDSRLSQTGQIRGIKKRKESKLGEVSGSPVSWALLTFLLQQIYED